MGTKFLDGTVEPNGADFHDGAGRFSTTDCFFATRDGTVENNGFVLYDRTGR